MQNHFSLSPFVTAPFSLILHSAPPYFSLPFFFHCLSSFCFHTSFLRWNISRLLFALLFCLINWRTPSNTQDFRMTNIYILARTIFRIISRMQSAVKKKSDIRFVTMVCQKKKLFLLLRSKLSNVVVGFLKLFRASRAGPCRVNYSKNHLFASSILSLQIRNTRKIITNLWNLSTFAQQLGFPLPQYLMIEFREYRLFKLRGND